MTILIEEEIIFHAGEVTGLTCKLFDGCDSFSGALAGLRNQYMQRITPGVLLIRRLHAHSMFDGR